jgi:hypothetical protein
MLAGVQLHLQEQGLVGQFMDAADISPLTIAMRAFSIAFTAASAHILECKDMIAIGGPVD